MLIGDILDVFRKGKSVANPELWKSVGATSSAVAGLATSALAVAGAFGYRVDLSDDLVQVLAGGIAGVLFLVNGGLHVITTDKIGLPAKPDVAAGVSDYSNSVGADPNAVSEFLKRAGNPDADRM